MYQYLDLFLIGGLLAVLVTMVVHDVRAQRRTPPPPPVPADAWNRPPRSKILPDPQSFEVYK